jgi:L-ascorbate metabolism protein UlaG (beta-lactamase superfamily)
MEQQNFFLKPNVVFEPLYANWYAWSHLVSPATCAMNVIGRHIPLMQSFIAEPDIHAQAVQNPKMRGGPFMDIKANRVEEIVKLRNDTAVICRYQIAFANAIKELERLLLQEAKGYGLESVYKKIPNILKGYVELFYDRNNNPSFRLFESLLYKSPFYETKGQSIALWTTDNDHRPFCLSTPRLNELNVINLSMPFNDPRIDELARMKKSPKEMDFIKSLLKIPSDLDQLFQSFFTEEAPAPYEKYAGKNIRMRYFGHACILIETAEFNVLVDPLISYYGYQSEIDHYSYEDLPDVINYVLITHNHQDHILFETLLPLRHRIENIVVPSSTSGKLEDPDLKLMFNAIGFENVISIGEMETVKFKDVCITGLPFIGEHSDLNILTKSCYLVDIGGFKMLFLADSRIVEPALYRHIFREIGSVDVMFLGMECDGAPLTWLYGPLMTKPLPRDQDNSRRLAGSNCEEGMALVDIFKPKEVYVYAMGQEPWLEFISSVKYTDLSNPIIQSNELVRRCRQKNIVAERLYGEKEIFYSNSLVNF